MLTGKNFIGSKLSSEGNVTFQTYNPCLEESNPTLFYEATIPEMEEALLLASKAFQEYKFYSANQKKSFFKVLEIELLASKDDTFSLYRLESGLSESRAESEFERTIIQIQQFINLFESEDVALPSLDITFDEEGGIRSDIRKLKIGLGPVVVFGASNFPLAYSTVGGDVVSALAAGCSVVVKSHPMHAGTGEAVASVILNSLKQTGFPDGLFSNLNGNNHEIGSYLVGHPLVKAVAFTGSFQGGMALHHLASKRSEPIPVFAEMGSLNPVVIHHEKLFENTDKWIRLLSESLTNDAGQFCTKPGLFFIEDSKEARYFVKRFIDEVEGLPMKTMVHPNLKSNFELKLNELKSALGYERNDSSSAVMVKPSIIAISSRDFLENTSIQEEFFGPFGLIVICEDKETLERCLSTLKGQLTASVFVDKDAVEAPEVSQWIRIFHEKAGRINLNNVPTGVRVCASMHHGGPFPASTDSRFGAVGIDSIERFLRPLCFQNFPNELLPEVLKDANPLKVLRRINGELSFAEIIR